MSILEVEGVEKFLGFLLADLLERFLHRERRARVLCHGISLHLGLHPVYGIDLDRRRAARFTIRDFTRRRERGFWHVGQHLRSEKIRYYLRK